MSPSVFVRYALTLKNYYLLHERRQLRWRPLPPCRSNSENSRTDQPTDSFLLPVSACIDVVRMRHTIFLEQIVHLVRGKKQTAPPPYTPEKKSAEYDHLETDTPWSKAVRQKFGWCPSRPAQWSPGQQRRAGWPKSSRSTRPCAPTTECTDRCTFMDLFFYCC